MANASYLTNATVSDPWTVVDGYDDRSWIENGLFRNSKQFWRLTRWFPQKTEAGVQSHLTFVVMVLAVATAYRLWDQAQVGTLVDAPDQQIAQVVHRVIDAQTGAVSVTPEPKRRGARIWPAAWRSSTRRPPSRPCRCGATSSSMGKARCAGGGVCAVKTGIT